MELPTAVVPVYAEHLCRACLKELETTTVAEANARVNLLDMPVLMDKLSACISNIFVTTERGSKYLCLDCFDRVNEFYEFREMCLQSIRWFEETQESKYVITYMGESIEPEGTNDNLLPSEPVIKQEYDVHDVIDLPEAVVGPLENPKVLFNKKSIESEGTNDILLPSKSVIKEEYELNDPETVSNRQTACLPEGVNEPAEILQEPIEIEKSEINSVQKLTQKIVVLDMSAENEDEKVVQMSVDDLVTVASVKNEYISNEDEEESNINDSRNANTHNDYQTDGSDEHEHGICSKANPLSPKSTPNLLMDTERNLKRYNCDKCPKRFNKESNLIMHMRKHEGLKPYHCKHEGCGKSFLWAASLKIHQRRHDNANKRFHCAYEGCGKSFSKSINCITHQKRHDSENGLKRYHCTHEGCDKSYAWPLDLKYHQNRHDNPNSLERYHCTHKGCHKSYSSLSILKRHQERHDNPNSEHGLKRYHCTHEGCDKSYAWPLYLKIHQTRHHNPNNIERYHCTHEGCDKSYSWLPTLKNHQKSHDSPNSEHDPKLYPCTHEGCHKSFSRPEKLKGHQRRHDPNRLKRYYCTREGCDKSFLRRETLNTHLRRHDNPNSLKRYYCMREGCDKSYAHTFALKRHQNTHHNPNSINP